MKFLTTIFFICSLFNVNGQDIKKKFTGSMFPPVDFKLLNGKKLTSKELNGKLIMLNFWLTSCQPCVAEIPYLNKLREKYKNQVLFIAVTPEIDKVHIISKLKKHPFNFAIAYSAKGLFNKLGIASYPVNFFINSKGLVKVVTEGTPYFKGSSSEEWEISVVSDYSKIIDELIAEKD